MVGIWSCPERCEVSLLPWQCTGVLAIQQHPVKNKSKTDTQDMIEAQTPRTFKSRARGRCNIGGRKRHEAFLLAPDRLCMLDGAAEEEMGREREKGEEKWELMLSLHNITSEISGVVGYSSHPKPQKTALTINTFYQLLTSPHCLNRRMEKMYHRSNSITVLNERHRFQKGFQANSCCDRRAHFVGGLHFTQERWEKGR